MTHRPATHAGSWYSANAAELNAQMSEWLGIAAASSTPSKENLHAIIAPHAGYRYSGQTAAHAYCALFASPRVERVFILGPSHHYSTRKCLLSQAAAVETPFGSIAVDTEINFQLALTSSSLIGTMDAPVDAAEHSLEMQFPFVARASRQRVANGHCPLRIVPIMVGSCLQESEAALGRILAPYFDDPCNVFVISSDFCNFGRRFDYTFYDASHGEVWQSIEAIDRKGMLAIASKDPIKFAEYLETYENRICGRHPIGILLNVRFKHAWQTWSTFLKALCVAFHIYTCRHQIIQSSKRRDKLSTEFTSYAQSSQCHSINDSSVSYASAVVYET